MNTAARLRLVQLGSGLLVLGCIWLVRGPRSYPEIAMAPRHWVWIGATRLVRGVRI